MEICQAGRSEFPSSTLADDVIGQTKSLQAALIREHLTNELSTFRINLIRVEADVSESLVVNQSGTKLLKARLNQVATVQ